MKDRRLATRYASALLSVLSDPAQAEATDAFLDSVRRAMQDSAEFRDLMLDPAVPSDARNRVLRAMASERGLPKAVDNFLATVVDHRRAPALPSIAVVFHEMREEAMGIVPAELTTATPLGEETKQRAREALQRMTGKQVRLTCAVEPELLGGAVTRIGSSVYDGSLRTQLAHLRRRMGQE